MLNQIGRDIFSEICKMEIIDTHEHIMSQEEVKEEVVHLFKVFENSYANLDLISAGMSPDIWEKKNLVEIWEEFKKYQPHVLLTTFVKNILYSLKELYGLNTGEIKEDNYQEISEKITDSYNSNNWYKYVLKEKANIKISMLDAFWNVENFNYDRELFIPVLRTNAFILGREYSSPFPKGKWAHSTIESISEAWGVSIDDFESYLEIIKLAIKKYKKIGCPAVKIGTAYHRSLYFEKTDKREAAVIYKKDPKRISLSEQKKLQDFMAHYIIHQATSAEMAVQIHTGTFARNGSIIENGNPEQLNNLFLEYPSTRFSLFHFSYPYTSQVFSLAKMFSNVVLDFCWVPMISENFAKKSLTEFLDLIPSNKLMWGGDSYRVEEAFGGAHLCRKVISEVLSEKVKERSITQGKALKIAQDILFNNARQFYQLKI